MIVLASKSASRRAMLEAAGVSFDVRPTPVDERALEAGMDGAPPHTVALKLAEAKALAVTEAALPVLGSDSLVVVDAQRFDKPETREEAAVHLRAFSGRTMQLHSAAAIARGGEIVWRHAARADLQVRALSDGFVESYLDAEWPAVAGCVGVFRIEALGAQLFRQIDGDQFTVLGMPLLPVLAALRELGELPR
ncbi:MAG: Maf family protein [Alteraurantiacibacter sp.]